MDERELGRALIEYCKAYKVPEEYIIDILIDQKVVPMIRGKATEYNVFLILSEIVNQHEWSVQKLNLNAQTGTHDEDVSITHQRTGIIIKVECKNATRGSMKYSNRCQIKEPHCSIKCHKSRSDLSKAKTTNDRYLIGDFDIVVSNLSNAVIAGATYTEHFELLDDERVIKKLAEYYNVAKDYQHIFDATFNDWRCARADDIADENGVIPRTPKVLLENDPVWHPIEDIEILLNQIVRERVANGKRRRNRRG